MSLKHLTLGERMVLAARMMTVEHIRQEADAAGIDLATIEVKPVRRAPRVVVREMAGAIRQDLFRQPEPTSWPEIVEEQDDDREAA